MPNYSNPPFGAPSPLTLPVFSAASIAAVQLVRAVDACEGTNDLYSDAMRVPVGNLLSTSAGARDEAPGKGIDAERDRLAALANAAWAFEHYAYAAHRQGAHEIASHFFTFAYQISEHAIVRSDREVCALEPAGVAEMLTRYERLKNLRVDTAAPQKQRARKRKASTQA